MPLQDDGTSVGEEQPRSRRQAPVSRLNSSPGDIPSTISIPQEPVRPWSELPSPFKIHPFSHPLQPTPSDHVEQIESEWAYRQQRFLKEKRTNGEDILLHAVTVETLSEYDLQFVKRKQALAEFKAQPPESRATMRLPRGMNEATYKHTLRVQQNCGIADNNALRVMEGLSPSPHDEQQQLFEDQQVDQLLEGPSMGGLDKSAIFQRALTDFLDMSATSHRHGTTPPSSAAVNNNLRAPGSITHPQVIPDDASDTDSSVIETSSHVAQQAQVGESVNQGQIDTSSTVVPQQILWPPLPQPTTQHPGNMEESTAPVARMMPLRAFKSPSMMQHPSPTQSPSPNMMPYQSPNMTLDQPLGTSNPFLDRSPSMTQQHGNIQTSTPFIDGSRLQEHDEMRQKERKAALKNPADMAQQQTGSDPRILVGNVVESDMTWDQFRDSPLVKQVGGSQAIKLMQQSGLSQWIAQKHANYLREVQGQAHTVVRDNVPFWKILVFAEKHHLTQAWLHDLVSIARKNGYDLEQRRAEYDHFLRRVAQEVVSKGRSWVDVERFYKEKGFSKYQFRNQVHLLSTEFGWDWKQKRGESLHAAQAGQEQRIHSNQTQHSPQTQSISPPQQMMQDPRALAHQTQMSPQQQRQRSVSLQQAAMMRAISQSPQEQRVYSNQMHHSPQTLEAISPLQRDFRALISNWHPEQQAVYMRQYNMRLQQQRAQQVIPQLQQPFEPVSALDVPVLSIEAIQAHMQTNAEQKGQGYPVYFDKTTRSPSTKFSDSNSPKDSAGSYQSRTTTVSPGKKSPKRKPSPKKKADSRSTDESMPPGSSVLDFATLSSSPGCGDPSSGPGPQYQAIASTQKMQEMAQQPLMGHGQLMHNNWMQQQQCQQFSDPQLYQDNMQGMGYIQAHNNFQAPAAPMYPLPMMAPLMSMVAKRSADEAEHEAEMTPSKKARLQGQ